MVLGIMKAKEKVVSGRFHLSQSIKRSTRVLFMIILMVFISESTVLECLAKDELTVLSYSHSILKQFNELPVSFFFLDPTLTWPIMPSLMFHKL